MRLFKCKQILEAISYVKEGGQALHLMYASDWPGKAPAVFRRYDEWAHLMDDDEDRLVQTARELGVRVIVVARRGVSGRQHVDLCGKPLLRAKALCQEKGE